MILDQGLVNPVQGLVLCGAGVLSLDVLNAYQALRLDALNAYQAD